MIFFTPRLRIAGKLALILALLAGASASAAAPLSPIEQTLLKQSSPAAWEHVVSTAISRSIQWVPVKLAPMSFDLKPAP